MSIPRKKYKNKYKVFQKKYKISTLALRLPENLVLADTVCKVWNLAESNKQLTLPVVTESTVRIALI